MTAVASQGHRTRLAVLGTPIAHSRSPQLQVAAYDALELPWTFERLEVAEGELAEFVAGLDDSWRGLALTMPLKPEAFRLAAARSDVAEETGSVNTLLLEGRRGFNTDVYGIIQALRDQGIEAVSDVLVLGAGATARSVVAAVRRMGGTSVTVAARRAEPAREVAAFARGLGLSAEAIGLQRRIEVPVGLVVNSIPGGAAADIAFSDALRERPLLEIAYDPWPSPLVARWRGPAVSGLDMLLHQALAQVRIFVSGDPELALPREPDVLAAMRAAVGD